MAIVKLCSCLMKLRFYHFTEKANGETHFPSLAAVVVTLDSILLFSLNQSLGKLSSRIKHRHNCPLLRKRNDLMAFPFGFAELAGCVCGQYVEEKALWTSSDVSALSMYDLCVYYFQKKYKNCVTHLPNIWKRRATWIIDPVRCPLWVETLKCVALLTT